MPVYLKPNEFHVKDESTGNYLDINAVAEQSTAQTVAAVTAEGTTQIDRINTRATEVSASLPKSGEMEDMVAVPFVQATAYPAGKYVIYEVSGVNHLYLLPNGHEANVTWENTTKVGPLNLGDETSSLKIALSDQKLMNKNHDDSLITESLWLDISDLGTGYIKQNGTYGASQNWQLGVINNVFKVGDSINIRSYFNAINQSAASKCQYSFFDVDITSSNYTTVDSSHVIESGFAYIGISAGSILTENIVVPKGTVSIMISKGANGAWYASLNKYGIVSQIMSKTNSVEDLSCYNFFNILDKFTRIKNRFITSSGTFVPDSTHSVFIIPVDTNREQSLGRIRSSQLFYAAKAYDASMNYIGGSNANLYGYEIPDGCAFIGLIYADSTTNYDTLMVAYSSETSGGTSNLWGSIYPDVIGYIPYRYTDLNKVYSLNRKQRLDEIIEKIEKQNSLIGENFEPGFNLFDGEYIENRAMTSNATKYTLVYNSSLSCTKLIKIDPSKGKRIRTSVRARNIIVYDDDLNIVRSLIYDTSYGSGELSYPKNINISGGTYVAITYYNSDIDFSSLMVAYTDETSGSYTSTWSDIFPGVTEYVPYQIIPKVEEDPVVSLMKNLKQKGVPVTYDDNKRYTVTITGIAGSVGDWGVAKIEVAPGQVIVYDFWGKTNDDSYDNSKGGGMLVEFFDSNDNMIGTKYNAYVIGTKRLGYHRYGCVAPLEVAYARIRIFTRPYANIIIQSLNIKVYDCYPQRNRAGILYDGHLGMIDVAPRNTIPAIELGKKAGFSTMILNIRHTKDNVLVCLHDRTIDGTSDGSGNVDDYTYAELQEYDFGSWFNPIYTGTKIPTFAEAARLLSIQGIGIGTSIHAGALTDENITEVCNIFMKYGRNGNSFIKSFDYNVLVKAYAILGDSIEYIHVGVNTTAAIDTIASFPGKCWVEFSEGAVTQELVDYAISLGVPVSVYFANDSRHLRDMVNMGVSRFVVDTFSDNIFPIEPPEESE